MYYFTTDPQPIINVTNAVQRMCKHLNPEVNEAKRSKHFKKVQKKSFKMKYDESVVQ